MRTDVLQQVKIPAIGLIFTGALNGFIGFVVILSGMLRLFGKIEEAVPTEQSERLGYFIGSGFSYGVGFFSLVLAPLIIYGGVKMLGGKSLTLARVAAALSILPLSSCCFIIGIPFGIWALVVLGKPEVREFFENGENNQYFSPPPPRGF